MSENTIQCPKCGARYRAPEEIRRATVPCKKCGAVIELQSPPAPVRARAGAQAAHPAHGVRHAEAHGTSRRRHHAVARSSQKSLAIYVLFGAVALVGVVALFFILPGTRAPEFRQRADAAAPKKPTSLPAPAFPTPVPTFTQPSAPAPAAGAAQPSADGAATAEARGMVHPPTKLEHLAGTSAELRARIDDAVLKILDISSPRSGTNASKELIQIGKPAIPRVLSAWVDLNMSDDNDAIRANLLDQVLRQITRLGSKYRPQGSTPDEIRRREAARDGWFQWWGDLGADFDQPESASGG